MSTNDSDSSPFSRVDYWDQVSGGYSRVASWIMEPFSLKAIELLNPGPECTVLDVACGSGTLSLPLSSRVKEISAIDFSGEMISVLEKHIQDRNIKNIKATHGDGQNLPYENNSFDAVFSMFGLMFFPDRNQGFRELHRVLKAGKKTVVSSWAPLEKSSLMTVLSDALKAGYPEASSHRGTSFPLDNPDVFKSEMKQAGFEDICIHEVTCTTASQPPDRFWEIMSTGGPIGKLKRELGEQKWREISRKAIDYLTETMGEGGKETSTTAYIGVGTN